MATNLTLVSGSTRIDLNDRISYFFCKPDTTRKSSSTKKG